ncbi:SMP-30/gluconolactonase/LRE family protein [Actinopolymorpha pittospori]
MQRRTFLSTVALGSVAGAASALTVANPALAATTPAAGADTPTTSGAATDVAAHATSGSRPFPTYFSLPDGFQPEGIAIGPGDVAYFGSRLDGSIYHASLRTGRGKVFSDGPGTPSLGMKTDSSGRLYVAGGTGGDARIIDTRSGEVLASYRFATGTSFVNDVVLTRDAAWFTDSANAVLYALPRKRRRLPSQDDVVRVPLRGDIEYAAGTNANGITETPDGSGLLVVQSVTGKLFRVDTRTGGTREVDLGGDVLTNGDGLLLHGHTLYAVLNRLNTVAVLWVDRAGLWARVIQRRTDPRFDVPTTMAAFGSRLYLPNARFTTPPEPTTEYSVVAIRRW